MRLAEVHKVLKIVSGKLGKADFKWTLDGSVNLALQGVRVDIRDIDITTTRDGIEVFRTCLNELVVKSFEDYKKWSLVCDIGSYEVEINCYKDEPMTRLNYVKKLAWRELNVNVYPLNVARKLYVWLGREDKVRLIDEVLSR